MNLQRIFAIVEKDVKEFIKNPMLYLIPVTPIFLAFVYSRLSTFEDASSNMYPTYILIGITFTMVTANVMIVLIAEEYDKQTLQGLILSPASFIDLLVGKSLVNTIFSWLTLFISLLILGERQEFSFITICGIVLLFLFFLFLGLGVGLFTPSISLTTTYSMVILLIFGFSPFIKLLLVDDIKIIQTIASYLPVSLLMDIALFEKKFSHRLARCLDCCCSCFFRY